MPTGIVQFFIKEKGFGYIRVPETREEYFVSRTSLLEPIRRGDRVLFTVRENQQGAYADEVRCLKASNNATPNIGR